jgi:2-keto-3-deoxy-galactonokinase
MKRNLTVALSEFSKGRWAAESSDEPPLHPTELNLVTRVLSRLGKLSPLATARYLIAFFIGVAATLALQSYRGTTKEEMIVAAPASLDLLRQSVDKLAVEITKVQAAEQDILNQISTAPSRPIATPARNPLPRPPQARP